MRIPCWITKNKNTHSEYVIIIAFPLQQWLHERASKLRYTYVHIAVCFELVLLDRRMENENKTEFFKRKKKKEEYKITLTNS
jgi:hypothetical protein